MSLDNHEGHTPHAHTDLDLSNEYSNMDMDTKNR